MNKKMLITGASTGIGYATALHLKQQGYQIVAACRKMEDCQRLQQEGLQTVQINLNDSDSIQNGFKQALTYLDDRIDVLINNAGYAEAGAVEDISREQLRKQFETNVFGVIELSQLAIKKMRAQNSGTILNVSSILGVVAVPYKGAYNASKYALDGITDTLRLELRNTPIQVVLLNPGPVESDFRKNARQTFQNHAHFQESIHQDTYKQALDPKHYSKMPFSLTSEQVAKKIFRIIRCKHPKARYYVTLPAHLLAIARRILPTSILDRILAKVV